MTGIIRHLAAAVVTGALAGYLLFEVMSPGPAVQAAVPTGQIAGQAAVIDGDTLEVAGTRIRLHGIDAPEGSQTCLRDAAEWRCGHQASLALIDHIGDRPVICTPRDLDRYGRVVAVCTAEGKDLNAWMVSEGWALAYRFYATDYVPDEQAAETAKRGIWQGSFVPPWDWRRGTRLAAAQKPRGAACDIKGNISSKGERIYHVPGGMYYDRTRISAGKGERWFCSQAEARSAGWRRSRR